MFLRDALKAVEEVRRKNKIPIIVGGTHYYLEALMYITPQEL